MFRDSINYSLAICCSTSRSQNIFIFRVDIYSLLYMTQVIVVFNNTTTFILDFFLTQFWVCFLRSGFQDGWFLGAHYLKYHLEPTDGDTWLRGNEYVGSLNKCILLGPVWKCWGFGEHSAIIWLTSIQWKVNFHTECSKSEREKQILYINTYVWNLERWYWWTIYRAGIEMQR